MLALPRRLLTLVQLLDLLAGVLQLVQILDALLNFLRRYQNVGTAELPLQFKRFVERLLGRVVLLQQLLQVMDYGRFRQDAQRSLPKKLKIYSVPQR